MAEASIPLSRTIAGKVVEMTVPGLKCPLGHDPIVDGEEIERFDLRVSEALLDQGFAPGEVFRFVRNSLGLKASELAGLLGVRAETVSRWENDHFPPDRAVLVTLGQLVRDSLKGSDDTLRRLDAMARAEARVRR